MNQTTTRLRKTFQYNPDDDDDDDDGLPQAIDEEEQTHVIQTLHAQNTHHNKQYTNAFLALPLLSALLYIRPLLHASTFAFSLFGITSLGASAYVLCFCSRLPWERSRSRSGGGGGGGGSGSGSGDSADEGTAAGPLELYLPYLNAVLVALLALAGLVGARTELWAALLPGVVYGVVVAARAIMGSVDVGELEGLKYDYKGA